MSKKFSELFSEDNVPYSCKVDKIEAGIQTQYGVKTKYSFSFNGESYDYFPTDSAMKKLTGIQIGSLVEATRIPLGGGKNTYNFKVIGVSPITSGPVASFPQQDDSFKKEKGIIQERISIAGFLQALIGTFSNITHEQIESSKQMALELVDWSKKRAEELYDADHPIEI